MKLTTFAALLFCQLLCCGSSLLTQTARDVLANSHDRARAEVFLEQAIQENGNDAEPLTLLANLLFKDLKIDPAGLQERVEPLLSRLLVLREQDPSTQPRDLALALELNARLLEQLNRSEEAKPLGVRSSAIRKQIVQELQLNKSTVFVESLRVGNGVSAPNVLAKTDPQYTDEAREAVMSGTVLISTVIDPEGLPVQIELVRSLGFGLDEKAVQAVSLWRFKPGMRNGLPVPVRATIEVNFRLL